MFGPGALLSQVSPRLCICRVLPSWSMLTCARVSRRVWKPRDGDNIAKARQQKEKHSNSSRGRACERLGGMGRLDGTYLEHTWSRKYLSSQAVLRRRARLRVRRSTDMSNYSPCPTAHPYCRPLLSVPFVILFNTNLLVAASGKQNGRQRDSPAVRRGHCHIEACLRRDRELGVGDWWNVPARY